MVFYYLSLSHLLRAARPQLAQLIYPRTEVEESGLRELPNENLMQRNVDDW